LFPNTICCPSSAAEADFCPRAAVKSLLSAISMVRGRENA
jgi:hypothetical protein